MGDSELANPDSWSRYHHIEIHLQQRDSLCLFTDYGVIWFH